VSRDILHALVFAMVTHARLGSAAPTAMPAGGGIRRSRQLEGKAPAAAADTSTNCAYVTLLGEAGAAGGGGLYVMARGAGGGDGGRGAASGRHDEGQGVTLKTTLTVPSCLQREDRETYT